MDAQGWRPGAETEAEKLYFRDVENSSLPMVVIEVTFNAEPARVYAVVTDYDRFAEYIPNVRESRILKKQDGVQWVFQHLRFPGPVADRTYVIAATHRSNAAESTYRIDWQLAQQKFGDEVQLAGVMPARFSGFWELRPSNDAGSTEAYYGVHSDPGGHLPGWLTESMTSRYVQKVIEAIRHRLRSAAAR